MEIIKGLRSLSTRKKFLGAIIVIAFIAFFTIVLARYIIVWEVDLAIVAFGCLVSILILMLAIETRKRIKARRIMNRSYRKGKR